MDKLRMSAAAAAIGLMVSVAGCNRKADQPAKPQTDTSTAPAPAAPGPSSAAPGAATTPPGGTAAAPGAAGTAPGGTAAAPSGPVAGADRAFASEAAASGLAEVDAARYVADKTADAKLKSFAQQMEREHASVNDELKRIASGKGITLPNAAEGEAKTRLDKLKTLPPAQLDSSFIQDFGINAHNEAIKLFERQAREGQDPELRAFAERTLPKLREHLGMVQQLQGKKAGGA